MGSMLPYIAAPWILWEWGIFHHPTCPKSSKHGALNMSKHGDLTTRNEDFTPGDLEIKRERLGV